MYWITSFDGLYIYQEEIIKILDYPCFGLQVYKKRIYIFALDNADDRTNPIPSGKIISFLYDEINGIHDIITEITGIDNGTHHIMIYNHTMYIQETYFQRIKTFNLNNDNHLDIESEQIIYPFEKDAYIRYYLEYYNNEHYLEQHKYYRHMNAITVQDGFYYILSPYLGRKYSSKIPTITVFHPNFENFAEIKLPTSCIPHELCFYGSDIIYLTNHCEIVHFNIFLCKITKILHFHKSSRKWMRGLSFDGEIYVLGCGKTMQFLNKDGVHIKTLETNFHPCFITKMDPISEYNNVNSDVRKSYVKTCYQFSDELIVYRNYFNNLYYNRSDVELVDKMKCFNLNNFYFKTIYFTSTINGILNPNPYIFHNHLNIQLETCSLTTRTGIIPIQGKYRVTGHFNVYTKGTGIGWHHNIDTVLRNKKNPKRIYMIRLDDTTFGASFFLYKHPISKLIHFVPDVDDTYKEFEISTDTNNPFWHAVASINTTRFSFGLAPLH